MNISNQKNRVGQWAVTICVIVIILIVSLFFCIQKCGFYEDEVVSYGLANSHYASWIWNVDNRYDSSDMTESVIDREYINKYITVDKTRTFDYESTYTNQIKDVHPPLYYLFLHTACSLTPETFSKWQGLVPNIVFFYLTILFLYFCIDRLCKDKHVSAIAVLLYAISNLGITTLLFIRMYCLLTFFTVLLIYLIIRFIQEDSIILYPLIGLTIMLGMLTQYIYIFYAFSICLITVLFLLRCRKIKKMFFLGVSAICGVLSMICIFPYIIQQIRVGANYGTVSGEATVSRVLDIGSYANNFKECLIIFLYMMPAAYILLFVKIGINYIIKIIKKEKQSIFTMTPAVKESRHIFIILLISLVLCFILLVITNPVISSRYFLHIMPLCFVLLSSLICKDYESMRRFNLKNQTMIQIFVITLSVVISLLLIRPEFLYYERRNYCEELSSYSHSPAVYVTGDLYYGVGDGALPFLRESNDVYILKNKESLDSYSANNYIHDHTDNDHLLLYIRNDITKPDSMVNSILSVYNYDNADLLFITERLYVYVLNKV